MFKRLCRAEQGSIPVFLIVVMSVLIGFIGLAIDTARGYAVKQHLQKAVDAATLAATKVLDDTSKGSDYPRTVGEAYFWENWRQGFLGSGPVTLSVTFDRAEGLATVNAKVDLPPVIMGYFGVDDFHFDTNAEAQRKKISLELAIALDNTASMAQGAETGIYNSVPSDVAKRRISIMKNAAQMLLDTLYEGKDEVPNMYISVIPFTSMVNVGSTNTHFLRNGASSLSGLVWAPSSTIVNMPNAWKTSISNQNAWRGCVFERGAGKRTGFSVASDYTGNDLTDAPPAIEGFYPYNVAPASLYVGVACRTAGTSSSSTGCYVSGTYNCQTGTTWSCPPEGACTATPVYGTCNSYTCTGTTTTTTPKYDNGSFTDREISTYGVKTTYVNNNTASPNFGKYCTAADTSCTPNRGPARRCFGTWVEMPEWDKPTANTNYVITPNSFWAGYPYLVPQTATGAAQNYNTAGTKNNAGSTVSLTYPTFNTITNFKAVVYGDDVSTCGSAANTSSYGGCSNTNMNDAGRANDTFGRWIPSWPYASNTPETVKLGGWGNSGCGLPILPLATKYADVWARINNMDVPLPDATSASNPARGYYGTIINQGLVWAWRTISPSWRNLWTGAASSLLPYDYTDSSDVHNKAIVILTDGLNYIQRYQDVSSNANPSYTSLIGWNDGTYSANYNSYRIDHRDYDTTAYGRLMDRWIYKNGNGTLIAYNSTASDEATKGTPAYQEMNRRLLATCDNIRAKGIKIFLIAFAIEASPVKANASATFSSCVGATGKFYDAINEQSLRDAFRDIAAQLVELRLTK